MSAQVAITMRMKDMFFDRAAVQNRMTAANRKALSRAGAFIRRRARSRLRRRKNPSAPGQSPSVHSTSNVATLKNILFAYEPRRESLVVGPVALHQINATGFDLRSQTVPQIHEFGGAVSIREWRFVALGNRGEWWDKYSSSAKFSGVWRRRDQRWRNTARKRRKHTLQDLGVQTRTRVAAYPARPFMGPALEAELDNIPDAWAGTLGD